jgi:hypothetical protein
MFGVLASVLFLGRTTACFGFLPILAGLSAVVAMRTREITVPTAE